MEYPTSTIKTIEKNEVLLITDGACALDGPRKYFGGYGYILKYGDVEVTGSGNLDYPATNQSAELTAALMGLKAIKRPMKVTLVSDSEYLLKGLCGLKGEDAWLSRWLRNGFRGANGKQIINKDLWLQLQRQKQIHQIEPFWIRGHTPIYKQNDYHRLNSRCDEMAVTEAIGAYERSLVDKTQEVV